MLGGAVEIRCVAVGDFISRVPAELGFSSSHRENEQYNVLISGAGGPVVKPTVTGVGVSAS